MLNDLVYVLQNRLITPDALYAHAIRLFDTGSYDISRLFSELSRISAVAKFSGIHDSGITSAFTDRTFELIAEHKSKCTSHFTMSSLLESGYDEVQMQMPGFVSGLDDLLANDAKSRTEDNVTSVELLAASDMSLSSKPESVVDNSVLDTSLIDSTDSQSRRPAELMNNNMSLNVVDETLDICSDKFVCEPSQLRDSNDELHDHNADQNRSNCESVTPIRSKLIDMSIYDPENPDKYSEDYEEFRLARQVRNNDDNVIDSNTGMLVEFSKPESAIEIAHNYALYHKKYKDSFRPNDYYNASDLCFKMTDKHKNLSIYDINDIITHLPLSNKRDPDYAVLNRFMRAYPLSIKKRVSYVPRSPAIFSSFVRIYESYDMKTVYLDCYIVRLIKPNDDCSELEFKFSQQHIDALHANLQSYIREVHKVKLNFQFAKINEKSAIIAGNTKFVDKQIYKYAHLVIFTTYHTYVFKTIAVVLYTKYDKLAVEYINATE